MISTLSQPDLQWLAGLFEGEGCIGIFPQGRGCQNLGVRLSVEMCDKDVVERFHSLVGTGTFGKRAKKQKPHWKDQWIWRCGVKNDNAELLGLLYPVFGKRRKVKAKEALMHLQYKRDYSKKGA